MKHSWSPLFLLSGTLTLKLFQFPHLDEKADQLCSQVFNAELFRSTFVFAPHWALLLQSLENTIVSELKKKTRGKNLPSLDFITASSSYHFKLYNLSKNILVVFSA